MYLNKFVITLSFCVLMTKLLPMYAIEKILSSLAALSRRTLYHQSDPIEVVLFVVFMLPATPVCSP